MSARELHDEREFEQWYAENAFDYERNPIGSHDCGLMRKAWKASRAALLSSVEDGDGIVRELTEAPAVFNEYGTSIDISGDTLDKAAARIMLDAQEKAVLQAELARLKEVAHNNAERSNANYVAMQRALEFIDLTIERREAFAEYRAAFQKEGA